MTPIKRLDVQLGLPITLPGIWALIDWKHSGETHIQLIFEAPTTSRPDTTHTFILIDTDDDHIPSGFHRLGCRRGTKVLYFK